MCFLFFGMKQVDLDFCLVFLNYNLLYFHSFYDSILLIDLNYIYRARGKMFSI